MQKFVLRIPMELKKKAEFFLTQVNQNSYQKTSLNSLILESIETYLTNQKNCEPLFEDFKDEEEKDKPKTRVIRDPQTGRFTKI